MKKIKNIIILTIMMLPVGSATAQDIEEFVNRQLQTYPRLHLLDLYKSCFQDYMGAEHLVTDRERVRHYLEQELATTSVEDLPEWYDEPCGIKGRFVRVSLRAVKEGRIANGQLLDAFIRSANTKRPSVKAWKRKWHKTIGRIDEMGLSLPDYEKERQFIDSLLSAGQYAISHSSEYRQAYHPHYRIVERRIFEEELKPCLEKRTFSAVEPILQGDLQEHSPSVLIIMYDIETGKEPLLKAVKDYKAEIIYDYNIIPGMAIKKPDDKTLDETMRYFKKVKGVVSVEYDRIYHLTDPVKPTIK